MSLRLRLNLLIALLMAIAWTAILGAFVVDVGPRASTEFRSMMHLARQHIDRSLVLLRQSPDPSRALDGLLADLGHLRHIRVAWEPDNAQGRSKPSADRSPQPPPGWWGRWLAVDPGLPEVVAVDLRGVPRGSIVISAYPNDEVDEIAQNVSSVALKGMALCLAMLVLSSLLVSRSLAPVDAIGATLARLSRGDYDAAVRPSGPPELVAICDSLNHLARALANANARNVQLTRDLVQVRDDERRELARDLHDELGPYLFAVRASGSALLREVSASARRDEQLQQLVRSMLEHIERIQSVNRRVLTQLSPPGLSELGLRAALSSLAEQWRRLREDLSIDLEIGADVDALGDAEALTVYRVVQEGITNAVRHGKSSKVHARVSVASSASGSEAGILVVIADDGSGIRPGEHQGFGMRGMRDRVQALGGTVTVKTNVNGGTTLEARLPA